MRAQPRESIPIVQSRASAQTLIDGGINVKEVVSITRRTIIDYMRACPTVACALTTNFNCILEHTDSVIGTFSYTHLVQQR